MLRLRAPWKALGLREGCGPGAQRQGSRHPSRAPVPSGACSQFGLAAGQAHLPALTNSSMVWMGDSGWEITVIQSLVHAQPSGRSWPHFMLMTSLGVQSLSPWGSLRCGFNTHTPTWKPWGTEVSSKSHRGHLCDD